MDAPRYFGSHIVINVVGFPLSNNFYPIWEQSRTEFKINNSLMVRFIGEKEFGLFKTVPSRTEKTALLNLY